MWYSATAAHSSSLRMPILRWWPYSVYMKLQNRNSQDIAHEECTVTGKIVYNPVRRRDSPYATRCRQIWVARYENEFQATPGFRSQTAEPEMRQGETDIQRDRGRERLTDRRRVDRCHVFGVGNIQCWLPLPFISTADSRICGSSSRMSKAKRWPACHYQLSYLFFHYTCSCHVHIVTRLTSDDIATMLFFQKNIILLSHPSQLWPEL